MGVTETSEEDAGHGRDERVDYRRERERETRAIGRYMYCNILGVETVSISNIGRGQTRCTKKEKKRARDNNKRLRRSVYEGWRETVWDEDEGGHDVREAS